MLPETGRARWNISQIPWMCLIHSGELPTEHICKGKEAFEAILGSDWTKPLCLALKAATAWGHRLLRLSSCGQLWWISALSLTLAKAVFGVTWKDLLCCQRCSVATLCECCRAVVVLISFTEREGERDCCLFPCVYESVSSSVVFYSAPHRWLSALFTIKIILMSCTTIHSGAFLQSHLSCCSALQRYK